MVRVASAVLPDEPGDGFHHRVDRGFRQGRVTCQKRRRDVRNHSNLAMDQHFGARYETVERPGFRRFRGFVHVRREISNPIRTHWPLGTPDQIAAPDGVVLVIVEHSREKLRIDDFTGRNRAVIQKNRSVGMRVERERFTNRPYRHVENTRRTERFEKMRFPLPIQNAPYDYGNEQRERKDFGTKISNESFLKGERSP